MLYQVAGVSVLPLIIMLLGRSFQTGGSQLGVGHIHGPGVLYSNLSSQGDLITKVVLTKVIHLVRGIHIMLAVEHHLVNLFLVERPVNIKGNRSLTNVHAQMCLYGLQRQSLLTIIHQVILVEKHPVLLQHRVAPPLLPLQDNEVIHVLHLFRREPTQNGF